MRSVESGKTRSQGCKFDRAEDVVQPGTPWEKLIKRLVGRKILVLKCGRDHIRDEKGDVLVALPDTWLDAQKRLDWFEVVAISPDCEDFTLDRVGHLVHCPVYADGMHRLWDHELHRPSDFFIMDEKLIGDGNYTAHIKPYTLAPGDKA